MLKFRLIILAIALDFILGDPYKFPHPIKLMGNLINLEDKKLRQGNEKTLRRRGFLLAIFNIVLTFFLVSLILNLVAPWKSLYKLVYVYLVYTSIAARSLDFEASKVKDALKAGLDQARHQLSFIVGRETKNLEEDEIIKATIETVAENTSDGVIAPLFFTFLLGPAGGLSYKMVNTMDSMLGYKNEKYMDFGRYPALIDDLFNYLPARFTGFLMCLVGLMRGKNAFPVMLRDKYNHKSPNAGFPESAVAGILGIQLGGNNFYNGKLVEKPTIGDRLVGVNKEHITDTINIMYGTETLTILIYYIILKLL